MTRPARLLAALLLALVVQGAQAARAADGVAIVIGNRDYAGDLPDARYAARDARLVRRHLVDRLGYAPENVALVEDATGATLRATLGTPDAPGGSARGRVTPDETALVVYFSGHGVPGRLDGGAYLLPVDADPEDPVATGYPVADLYASLLALAPRSLVVILEAGFAADSFAGAVLQSPAAPREDALAPPPGAPVTLLAATRGDEIANWDEQAQLGLFTRFLLLGLDGGADDGRLGDGDGRVTLAELDGWLAEELGFAARRRFGRNQRATVIGDPGAVLAQRIGESWPPRPSLGELRAAADALARSPDAAPPAEPEPVLAVPDQPAGAEPGR